MPYSLFHLFFLGKSLGTIPGLAVWSVSCCSLLCSNECILLPPQILLLCHPHWGWVCLFSHMPRLAIEMSFMRTRRSVLSRSALSHKVSHLFLQMKSCRYCKKQGACSTARKLWAVPKWSGKRKAFPWAKVRDDTKCISCGCAIKCEMEVGCSWPGDRIPSNPSEKYGKAKNIGLLCVCYIPKRNLPFS